MNEKYNAKFPDIKFKKMDAKHMIPNEEEIKKGADKKADEEMVQFLEDAFEEEQFDCIIDKACFDSVLCGEGSGPNSHNMLSEVHKVLKPGGVYICISYGIPEDRESFFESKAFNWKLTTTKVAKQTSDKAKMIADGERDDPKHFHFVYIMKR